MDKWLRFIMILSGIIVSILVGLILVPLVLMLAIGVICWIFAGAINVERNSPKDTTITDKINRQQ